MKRVVEDDLPSDNYYLPHHGVYKSGSTTTPLRVVFNASSSSSNGVSPNDVLIKDKLSRGLVPQQLGEYNPYWNGPRFLQEPFVPMNFDDH
ncbi:hypothetical protein AVEN_63228-1 [Araneus ventricosus]|uniref:Uncharacterized protein n=1 Tax=Araneus ventricosus TaxID=182803 RepID=A0A4Y2B4C7_ARAVE|nr:hypothetical protein AVEN_63228-1 [Araneus ventricosus]